MWIYIVIALVVGMLICGIPLYLQLRKHESINESIRQQNKEAEETLVALNARKSQLQEDLGALNQQMIDASKMADEAATSYAQAALDRAMAGIETSLDTLSAKYQEAAADYDREYIEMMADLTQDMNNTISIKKNQIAELEQRRESLAQSISATIQAKIREKEIKEKLDFYCLSIDPLDLTDIQTLEKVKSRLNKPRILSMLIWQTYYQKPMTQLCNDILGTSTVTGIYKITNQTTDQVYIGQARDMAARWKEHAKCGLDIDRPAGNKLYQAMIEDGITNFSWELLEKCTVAELNEKERKYIELYQSSEYGYNSNKGVSK
jgi:hypothetical protein